jgi:hypothetical protein
MIEAKGVQGMRSKHQVRSRRLRAAVVGAAVAAASLVLGHGALAVDSSFTQTCGTGSSLDIHSISVTNDANNVTYGLTMCSAFTATNVSRIAWQFSFSDSGQSNVPVDACLVVEPSDYAGGSSGLNGYVTSRCVGDGVPASGAGLPDAAGGGLLGEVASPITLSGAQLTVVLPISTLRQAGLGGGNSYEFRVVTRDTDSAAHLASLAPQDAAPESVGTFLTHQLGSTLTTLTTMSIGDAKKKLTGGTSTIDFPVTLSAASARPVSVHYVTGGGTAVAGKDYTAQDSTLTIAAGSTTGTISVPVKHGKVGKHTFNVTLDSPQNATLTRSVATGTIIDK